MSVSKPDPSAFDLTDVKWQVSSHSGGGGNCVRIASKNGYILVGDSQNPDRLPHVYTLTEFRAFALGARDGEFDHLTALD
ncbi:DUF397 domain-containing protein [Streptosporangium oxazolinicum]|uniref:DUF397 domain-containing protein n=1 Tax=Streptosporangium oxazolinicum TaxID=909287 RepID=A0ABP8B7E2_9ACTN